MIHFEGDRTFPLPVETVAAKLSDAAFLLSCLDKVDQVIESTSDRAVWKLRTGFSFLSTNLEVQLTVVERAADFTRFEAFSKGVGATSLVKAKLTFAGEGDATTVHYDAEVAERTGLLKIVSAGLIQAAAKSVIEETWKGIEAKLSNSAAT